MHTLTLVSRPGQGTPKNKAPGTNVTKGHESKNFSSTDSTHDQSPGQQLGDEITRFRNLEIRAQSFGYALYPLTEAQVMLSDQRSGAWAVYPHLNAVAALVRKLEGGR